MPTIDVTAMRDRIGTEAVSAWVDVTQAMIDMFADATGDHQFIHVDADRAAQTPFGGTIAHGFLTLSLLPQLMARTPDAPAIAGAVMGVNYGANSLRFLTPVRSGSRVRSRTTPIAFEEKRPGQWQRTDAVTVEIEGVEKPALVAEWITQIFVAPIA